MAVTGTISLAMGLLVVIGWHTGHILPSSNLLLESEPVRYNAGLCFLFGGIALLLLVRGQFGLVWLASAPVAIVGLLTGCEYAFTLNLGLDDLFFRTSELAPSIPPRMAPNTAMCFTLLGGALLLASEKPRALGNGAQAVVAALAAAVGLVGFIGYVAGVPAAYSWGRFTPMAAPTAAVMCALGLGVIAFAWRQYTAGSAGVPRWLPLVGALTLTAGSVALWQALHVLHPESALDVLILVMGLMQAALLYLVLHLLRSMRERAQQLRQLNTVLHIQMSSLERAERELQGRQAYTRSLIEASLDPLVTISPDGKITDVNAATEAATGCSRQELVGTDFCDYFTQPNRARAGYQQVFREGIVRDYELEIRHREGRLIPVVYNAATYQDRAGAVIGVFAAARDITERKKTEQALRYSEERYRALLVATAQVVWTTPPDGMVEDMPMWREYTGQTVEQVRGWGWLEALHPEDRERTAAVWSKAVETRSMYETEFRIRRSDGQYRHFSIRGVPVLEQNGSIREWVGTCTDIHERKQIEDELRRQAALLDLAHDAILVRDLQSKVVYWNRGAEETYSWSAKEAVGRLVHELLQTRFPVPLPDIEAAFLQNGEWEGELQHFTHEGRSIVVASRWSLQRDRNGAPANILEINRDISDRKQLEDSLRQRTLELENSVAELEAFSYSVSHDLRAPLRSVDGFSQILLEDYRDEVDAEGQDYLRRIRVASQNMGQLIDALLQLSRVMRSELAREPVDLSLLALSTAALIQKAEPSRQVRLHIANGLQARGDRRLLGVALQNLLQNAWKFTARNPDPNIEFGSTQKDGTTAYYVRDNGIGFDMTYVGKLFTPFQRLHAREQFEGTGIGLATVQRIIKRHGGRVWAEGAVGKGATFYFSLES